MSKGIPAYRAWRRKFGKLFVIRIFYKETSKQAYAKCKCDCGAKIITTVAGLRNGHTKSCGCSRRSFYESLHKKMLKHGHFARKLRSSEYIAWMNMISRCYKNGIGTKYHGQRGIKVCERWRGSNGFKNFLKDMENKPGPAYSLDRYPNNDGDYCPENCRWATAEEQANNRRKPVILYY